MAICNCTVIRGQSGVWLAFFPSLFFLTVTGLFFQTYGKDLDGITLLPDTSGHIYFLPLQRTGICASKYNENTKKKLKTKERRNRKKKPPSGCRPTALLRRQSTRCSHKRIHRETEAITITLPQERVPMLQKDKKFEERVRSLPR